MLQAVHLLVRPERVVSLKSSIRLLAWRLELERGVDLLQKLRLLLQLASEFAGARLHPGVVGVEKLVADLLDGLVPVDLVEHAVKMEQLAVGLPLDEVEVLSPHVGEDPHVVVDALRQFHEGVGDRALSTRELRGI